MTGFLCDIWETIEHRGCAVINDSTRRAIAIECSSPELAAEFIRVARDPSIWHNPIKCQTLIQSGKIVHLIW